MSHPRVGVPGPGDRRYRTSDVPLAGSHHGRQHGRHAHSPQRAHQIDHGLGRHFRVVNVAPGKPADLKVNQAGRQPQIGGTRCRAHLGNHAALCGDSQGPPGGRVPPGNHHSVRTRSLGIRCRVLVDVDRAP